MLFLFCLADCETGAYISHDPMFKDVSGYQSGVDFLTAGMCTPTRSVWMSVSRERPPRVLSSYTFCFSWYYVPGH